MKGTIGVFLELIVADLTTLAADKLPASFG